MDGLTEVYTASVGDVWVEPHGMYIAVRIDQDAKLVTWLLVLSTRVRFFTTEHQARIRPGDLLFLIGAP